MSTSCVAEPVQDFVVHAGLPFRLAPLSEPDAQVAPRWPIVGDEIGRNYAHYYRSLPFNLGKLETETTSQRGRQNTTKNGSIAVSVDKRAMEKDAS